MLPDPNAPWCLRFWFHMFGPVVGALRVLLRVYNLNTPSLRQIWRLSGSAGNAWFMAQVTVSSVHDFQVRQYSYLPLVRIFFQHPSSFVGRKTFGSVWLRHLTHPEIQRNKYITYQVWSVHGGRNINCGVLTMFSFRLMVHTKVSEEHTAFILST
jgi:hypothetical protein